MEENLIIGDFGNVVFNVVSRVYYLDAEGKMRYKTVKTPFIIEGAEVTDADKGRIWIEGIDKENPECYNVRRCNVISFERQERPVPTKTEEKEEQKNEVAV